MTVVNRTTVLFRAVGLFIPAAFVFAAFVVAAYFAGLLAMVLSGRHPGGVLFAILAFAFVLSGAAHLAGSVFGAWVGDLLGLDELRRRAVMSAFASAWVHVVGWTNVLGAGMYWLVKTSIGRADDAAMVACGLIGLAVGSVLAAKRVSREFAAPGSLGARWRRLIVVAHLASSCWLVVTVVLASVIPAVGVPLLLLSPFVYVWPISLAIERTLKQV